MESRARAYLISVGVGGLGLTLVLLIMSACRSPAEYFPLPAQAQWRYRLNWTSPGLQTTTYYVQRVIDPPEGLRNAVHARMGLDGRGLIYSRDSEGIWQLGRIEPGSAAPLPLERPWLVLPSDPRPGQTWTVSAKPPLLTRLVTTINAGQASLAAADSFLREVTMHYSVQGVGAALVAAGRDYRDCVHLLGEARDDLVGAPQFGSLALRVEEHLWYCRGVGLVRLHRDERTDRHWASELSLDMALESYDLD